MWASPKLRDRFDLSQQHKEVGRGHHIHIRTYIQGVHLSQHLLCSWLGREPLSASSVATWTKARGHLLLDREAFFLGAKAELLPGVPANWKTIPFRLFSPRSVWFTMQQKNTKQAKRLSIDCCLPVLVVGHFVVGRWSKKSQANMVAIIAVVAPAAGRAHLQNITHIIKQFSYTLHFWLNFSKEQMVCSSH